MRETKTLSRQIRKTVGEKNQPQKGCFELGNWYESSSSLIFYKKWKWRKGREGRQDTSCELWLSSTHWKKITMPKTNLPTPTCWPSSKEHTPCGIVPTWFENATVSTVCVQAWGRVREERMGFFPWKLGFCKTSESGQVNAHKEQLPTPLFRPLQNTHGGFQPLTDVSAPKTNTETNIYRALKSQQKSPGHKVSLPGLEISGLGLLNRMSHLVSIAGQETLAPKGD